MPRRRVASVLALLVVVLAVGVVFALGQRGCPPPQWAFWRFTDGPDGRSNFACVAGR